MISTIRTCQRLQFNKKKKNSTDWVYANNYTESLMLRVEKLWSNNFRKHDSYLLERDKAVLMSFDSTSGSSLQFILWEECLVKSSQPALMKECWTYTSNYLHNNRTWPFSKGALKAFKWSQISLFCRSGWALPLLCMDEYWLPGKKVLRPQSFIRNSWNVLKVIISGLTRSVVTR